MDTIDLIINLIEERILLHKNSPKRVYSGEQLGEKVAQEARIDELESLLEEVNTYVKL